MVEAEVRDATLFEVRASVHVAAPAEDVYALVSDLPRSGEWSPECRGGRWVSGTPATVGAVFRGDNHRDADVVSWAPVVRGAWTTESEVVAAEPGQTFRWAIRDSAGAAQQSVWSYEIHPTDTGCELVHHFWMGRPTEGIRTITAGMDATETRRFVADWSTKLSADLAETLRRIKAIAEDTASSGA